MLTVQSVGCSKAESWGTREEFADAPGPVTEACTVIVLCLLHALLSTCIHTDVYTYWVYTYILTHTLLCGAGQVRLVTNIFWRKHSTCSWLARSLPPCQHHHTCSRVCMMLPTPAHPPSPETALRSCHHTSAERTFPLWRGQEGCEGEGRRGHGLGYTEGKAHRKEVKKKKIEETKRNTQVTLRFPRSLRPEMRTVEWPRGSRVRAGPRPSNLFPLQLRRG